MKNTTFAYVKSYFGLNIRKANLSKHPVLLLFPYVQKLHPALFVQTKEDRQLSPKNCEHCAC
jgi:hypothetical protein